MKKILFGAALICASAALAAEAPARFIQVTGEGEAKAAPDQVLFNFGLESAGRDLAQAKDDNAARTKALLAGLRKAGVEEKNIQTDLVRIAPRYDYVDGKRVFAEYTARKNFAVVFTDLTNYGKVLDAALAAGVEEVNGPHFAFAHPDALETQARARAAQDARAKAEALAKDLGVGVGEPLEILEAPVERPVPLFAPRAMKAEAANSTPDVFSAGESAVRASVSVKFALK